MCAPGYIHDQLLARFYNCAIATPFIPAFATVLILLCAVGMATNVYVRLILRPTGKLLRSMNLAAIFVNIFLGAEVLDIAISERITPWGATFFTLGVVAATFMVGYLILSILLPVSKIDSGTEFRFRPWSTYLLVVQPLLTLTGMASTFILAFTLPETGDALAVDSFNDATVYGFAALYFLVIVVVGPAFISFSTTLIIGLRNAKHIGERIIEAERRSSNNSSTSATRPSPDRPASESGAASHVKFTASEPDIASQKSLDKQAAIVQLLDRVRFIRTTTLLFGALLALMGVISTSFQVKYRTIPFFFVMYVTLANAVIVWSIHLAFYARKRDREARRGSQLLPFATQMLVRTASNLTRRFSHLGHQGSSKFAAPGPTTSVALEGDKLVKITEVSEHNAVTSMEPAWP